MTTKQNVILVMGIALILVNAWMGGQFSSLWNTVTTGAPPFKSHLPNTSKGLYPFGNPGKKGSQPSPDKKQPGGKNGG